MRIALYARCSTKKQDLESQLATLTRWAESKGYEYQVYTDLAVSGRKDSRTGINALLAAAEGHQCDLIGVVELSRIGRSIGFITSTIKRLQELGIKIVLVNTGTIVDYDTLEGSAMVNALAMAADIEWRLIHDRNARGREAIKERGVKVGRKHKEISLPAIHALQEKGMSLREIAAELGVSAPTIMRRLKEVS